MNSNISRSQCLDLKRKKKKMSKYENLRGINEYATKHIS
jgi:hypothetical protein